MGGKVSRNAPDNEDLTSPSFIMLPWFLKNTCLQSDPGGNKCCFWKDSDKWPTHIPYTSLQGPPGPQEGADEEGEEIRSQRTYWMLKILRSVSAIRAAGIWIFTSSEEADKATKLPKLPLIPLIWKISSVTNATKDNITTYVGGALN